MQESAYAQSAPRRCMRVRPVLPCRSGRRGRQQIIINGAPVEGPGTPGMAPRQFKTGTARIRGRVLSADTGTAVRRAQVRVSGPDIGMKVATTDEGGRFDFVGLPAGRFILAATKSGYVSVQYGQTRPFESGKPIELAEAQDPRQGRHPDPARERNIRNHTRRVRRPGHRRDGQRDAFGVVEWPAPPPVCRQDGDDERPGSVPPLRTARG